MPYADPEKRKEYAARHYRENAETYKAHARKNGLANRWYDASRDKEKRNEGRRVRYATDDSYSDKCKKRVADFRSKDPERWKKYALDRYEALKASEGISGTPSKFLEIGQKSRDRIRKAVLEALGGSCVRCGERIPKFLNVDHVHDGGREHRKQIRTGSAQKVHQEILSGKFPGKYQLLCWNCNHLKFLESSPRTCNQYVERYKEKARKEAFAKFGRSCFCCGSNDERILSLDHVGGGGSQQRKTLKKTGASFYRWAIKNMDSCEIRVACLNCNCGRHFHGGRCPHQGV